MDKSIWMSNIILSMREYQEKKCIRKQCITNVQYLYNCIKQNSSNNVKAKAVIVFSNNAEADTTTIVEGHLVVVLDHELIIEPSYDIFRLKNITYFDNIKDFIDIFEDKDILKTKVDIKNILYELITFTKFAYQINNGELLIADKKNYNEQADYIEKLHSK